MRSSERGSRSRRKEKDVSLLDRRKVLDCLDAIRGLGRMSQADTEELAQRLAGLGKIVPATLIQALETERDITVVGLAARTLECMAETNAIYKPRCIEALQRLVTSPDIPDESRMRLLVTLSRLGVDVSDARYAASFKDISAVAGAFREAVLSEISKDEFLLAQLLEEIAQLPADARVSMVEDYSQSEQPMALRLYRILGRSDDSQMGRAVVESLAGMRTPAAAAVLDGISQDSLSQETRDRAVRAVRGLRFSGIKPRSSFRKRDLGPIYSSLVSALDGVGSRMIWIARTYTRSSKVFGIHLMLNEQHGIKDCFGSTRMSRADYDERVESLNDPGDIAYQASDYEYCTALIRAALAINRSGGSPVAPQFLLLMELFGDALLIPEPYVPEFGDLDMEMLGKDRKLVRKSAETLRLPALSTWVVITDGIFNLAEKANRLAEPGERHDAFRTDIEIQMTRMRRLIVHQEILPGAPALRRRMELMADYLLRSARPNTEHARALLAAAQHLPQQVVGPTCDTGWPSRTYLPEQHPFLAAMAARSLENAQAALRMGLDYRTHPERF